MFQHTMYFSSRHPSPTTIIVLILHTLLSVVNCILYIQYRCIKYLFVVRNLRRVFTFFHFVRGLTHTVFKTILVIIRSND